MNKVEFFGLSRYWLFNIFVYSSCLSYLLSFLKLHLQKPGNLRNGLAEQDSQGFRLQNLERTKSWEIRRWYNLGRISYFCGNHWWLMIIDHALFWCILHMHELFPESNAMKMFWGLVKYILAFSKNYSCAN